jgi:hypothetical protein
LTFWVLSRRRPHFLLSAEAQGALEMKNPPTGGCFLRERFLLIFRDTRFGFFELPMQRNIQKRNNQKIRGKNGVYFF